SIRRTTPGPGFLIGPAADVTFERPEILAAPTQDPQRGYGISSPMGSGGTTTRILDSVIAGKESAGAHTLCGTHSARRSIIRNNSTGIQASDAHIDVDSCHFTENGTGLTFDYGRRRITNSFFTRSSGTYGALNIYESEPMESQVE